MKYQDIHTGKIFTVANNKVTDQFGNVATISAKEWLALQGGDVVKLSSTVVRETMDNTETRGSVMMVIECTTKQLASQFESKLTDFECIEECDSDHYANGVSLVYWMSSEEVQDFKAEYQLVKKTLI